MTATIITERSTSTFTRTILRSKPPTRISTPRMPSQVSVSNGFVPSNFSHRCPPRISFAPSPIRLVWRELNVNSAISDACLVSRLPIDTNSSIQGEDVRYEEFIKGAKMLC